MDRQQWQAILLRDEGMLRHRIAGKTRRAVALDLQPELAWLREGGMQKARRNLLTARELFREAREAGFRLPG